MHLNIIACDLDGTLAQDGKVADEMWEKLYEAKSDGLKLVLVTGRIMDTFISDGPYLEVFDAIIAENGALINLPKLENDFLPFGRLRRNVYERLEKLNIPIQKGTAIVTTHVPHDKEILDTMRETGGVASIEYNRGSVMLMPYGATKGTGLNRALNILGYSLRNVVACGDAENDRSLFEMAEFSAAVADATEDIKSLANMVLAETNGAGVRELISYIQNKRIPPHRLNANRNLNVGEDIDGNSIGIYPFSLIDGNTGIFGSSGSGKSWLAGLLAEELLKQGYQICMIDPEGDYRSLQSLANMLVLGGPDTHLPSVMDIITILEHTSVSLELDLSAHTLNEKEKYVKVLTPALRELRARTGRPHWFLFDEIQSFCPKKSGKITEDVVKTMQDGGFCLVSYRPSEIFRPILELLHNWIVTSLENLDEIEEVKPFLRQNGCKSETISQLSNLSIEKAYFLFSDLDGQLKSLESFAKIDFKQRETTHIRHLQKYLWSQLPEDKKFHFHDSSGNYLNVSVSNLWEFIEAVEEVDIDSVQYHLERDDFQNWLTDVYHDSDLINQLRKIKHRNLKGKNLRNELLRVARNRYEKLDRQT